MGNDGTNLISVFWNFSVKCKLLCKLKNVHIFEVAKFMTIILLTTTVLVNNMNLISTHRERCSNCN